MKLHLNYYCGRRGKLNSHFLLNWTMVKQKSFMHTGFSIITEEDLQKAELDFIQMKL